MTVRRRHASSEQGWRQVSAAARVYGRSGFADFTGKALHLLSRLGFSSVKGWEAPLARPAVGAHTCGQVQVLVASLLFIGSVTSLHILAKLFSFGKK
jgi:hypothetical protein